MTNGLLILYMQENLIFFFISAYSLLTGEKNGYRLLVCVFDPDQVGDEYRLSGVRIVISKLLYDFFA
jgi:hypothetical protein